MSALRDVCLGGPRNTVRISCIPITGTQLRLLASDPTDGRHKLMGRAEKTVCGENIVVHPNNRAAVRPSAVPCQIWCCCAILRYTTAPWCYLHLWVPTTPMLPLVPEIENSREDAQSRWAKSIPVRPPKSGAVALCSMLRLLLLTAVWSSGINAIDPGLHCDCNHAVWCSIHCVYAVCMLYDVAVYAVCKLYA